MGDNDDVGKVISIAMLSLIIGFGLLFYTVAPLFITGSPAEAQTLTVSTTLTDDNCDAATAVGDGACNAVVSVLPDEYGIAAIVGVLAIIGAFWILGWLVIILR